jgi:DNA-binding XRE family transcriptional regulator
MKNLRKRRDARKLSRFELAKLAGVSPDTIEQIEGGAGCRASTAVKLAQALGTTVEDLYGGKVAS